jgi:hypothetical protein
MRRAGIILAGTVGLMVAYPLLALGIYDLTEPNYTVESSWEENIGVDSEGYRQWTLVQIKRFDGYHAGQVVVMLIGWETAVAVCRTCEPFFRPALELARLVNGDEYRMQDHSYQSMKPSASFCG